MARSQVTGPSLLPSFPQTLDGERILGETATANGPTVPPRQYFGLTAMYLFELVASVVRSKAANGCGPEQGSLKMEFKGLKDVRLALWQQKTTTALKAPALRRMQEPKHGCPTGQVISGLRRLRRVAGVGGNAGNSNSVLLIR